MRWCIQNFHTLTISQFISKFESRESRAINKTVNRCKPCPCPFLLQIIKIPNSVLIHPIFDFPKYIIRDSQFLLPYFLPNLLHGRSVIDRINIFLSFPFLSVSQEDDCTRKLTLDNSNLPFPLV